MLVQFHVSNLFSFRDPVTFSMLATGETRHAARLHQVTRDGKPLLNCAAIYGANASGKSNFVKAVALAKDMILEGTRPGAAVPIVPFRLDEAAKDAPTRLEFEIDYQGFLWSYGFVTTAERIQAEWLYADDGAGKVSVFERGLPNTGATEAEPIVLGPRIPEARRQFVGFVATGTRPNRLFLTEAEERNVHEVAPVMEWFRQRLVVVRPGNTYLDRLAERIEEEPALAAFVGKLLTSAGTGIHAVSVQREPVSDTIRQAIRESGLPGAREAILVASRNPSEPGMYYLMEAANHARRLNFSPDAVTQDKSDSTEQWKHATTWFSPKPPKIKTHHRSRQGQDVHFDLTEESDGTQRLANLAALLYDVENSKQRADTVYLIDELDRSFHPALSRLYVQAFLDIAPENNRGQLLFTTHDTHLLDLALLRTDEIWFVDKDAHGGSSFYSLAEFDATELAKMHNFIEEAYLHGSFGAVIGRKSPSGRRRKSK